MSAEWRHVEDSNRRLFIGDGSVHVGTCAEDAGSWPCDAERQRLRADRLEGALTMLCDDADEFERQAKRLNAWSDNGPAEAITRAIQKYRAVLIATPVTPEGGEQR